MPGTTSETAGRAPHDRAAAPPRGLRLVLVGAALALLAAAHAFLAAFSGFKPFDDEGVLLLAFRLLAAGAVLYDEVYSFYGPAYHLAYLALYRDLIGGVTHDAARGVTAAAMLANAALGGLLAWRLSRSAATAVAAGLAVLATLTPMAHSPGHPEALCTLLAFALLLAVARQERTGARWPLAAIGAILAALLLVKPNAGLFLGAAWALVFARTLRASPWRSAFGAAVVVPVLAAPLLIMWPLLDRPWVQLYALYATVAIGAAVLAWHLTPAPARFGAADLLPQGLGFLLAAVLILGAMLAGGSSLGAMIELTVTQSGHFLRNWHYPARIDRGGLGALAIASAGLLACLLGGRLAPRLPWLALGEALKAAFLLLIAWQFVALFVPLLPVFGYGTFHSFWLLAPAGALLLIPPRTGAPAQPAARAALVLLAAINVLYPFPVSGHQTNVAAAPLAVIAALLAHDLLARRVAGGQGARHPIAAALAVVLLLSLSVGLVVRTELRRTFQPLDMPGARLVRAQPEAVTALHEAVGHLAACPASYSLPGSFSLQIWAGHRPPSGLNNNNPLGLLTHAQQERLVAALAAEPGLCIAVLPAQLAAFDRGQIATRPPLLRFLEAEFEPVAEAGGHLIHRRRTPAP